MKRLNLINSKIVFIATVIIIPTLSLIVYLTGLESHRSLYQNSLITTTILTIVFLLFTFIGLYKGWKLKDTLGSFKNYLPKPPANPSMDLSRTEFPAIGEGEGMEGCLLSLVIWIVLGLFGSFLFWLIGAFFWATILILAALLYWVIFRALRLIFRNSVKCKGDIIKSGQLSILYTSLYVFWIYGIIFIGHYLIGILR